jgi:hypothetical protein
MLYLEQWKSPTLHFVVQLKQVLCTLNLNFNLGGVHLDFS